MTLPNGFSFRFDDRWKLRENRLWLGGHNGFGLSDNRLWFDNNLFSLGNDRFWLVKDRFWFGNNRRLSRCFLDA